MSAEGFFGSISSVAQYLKRLEEATLEFSCPHRTLVTAAAASSQAASAATPGGGNRLPVSGDLGPPTETGDVCHPAAQV